MYKKNYSKTKPQVQNSCISENSSESNRRSSIKEKKKTSTFTIIYIDPINIWTNGKLLYDNLTEQEALDHCKDVDADTKVRIDSMLKQQNSHRNTMDMNKQEINESYKQCTVVNFVNYFNWSLLWLYCFSKFYHFLQFHIQPHNFFFANKICAFLIGSACTQHMIYILIRCIIVVFLCHNLTFQALI